MATNYGRSGNSVTCKLDIKRNEIPNILKQLGNSTLDGLKVCAQDALDFVEPMTPKDTGRLRDQTRIQVHGSGNDNAFGSVSISWMAQSDSANRYRYGIAQEHNQYQNYTTPGTGPGFMAAAGNYMNQTALQYIPVEYKKIGL